MFEIFADFIAPKLRSFDGQLTWARMFALMNTSPLLTELSVPLLSGNPTAEEEKQLMQGIAAGGWKELKKIDLSSVSTPHRLMTVMAASWTMLQSANVLWTSSDAVGSSVTVRSLLKLPCMQDLAVQLSMEASDGKGAQETKNEPLVTLVRKLKLDAYADKEDAVRFTRSCLAGLEAPSLEQFAVDADCDQTLLVFLQTTKALNKLTVACSLKFDTLPESHTGIQLTELHCKKDISSSVLRWLVTRSPSLTFMNLNHELNSEDIACLTKHCPRLRSIYVDELSPPAILELARGTPGLCILSSERSMFSRTDDDGDALREAMLILARDALAGRIRLLRLGDVSSGWQIFHSMPLSMKPREQDYEKPPEKGFAQLRSECGVTDAEHTRALRLFCAKADCETVECGVHPDELKPGGFVYCERCKNVKYCSVAHRDEAREHEPWCGKLV